MSSRTAQLSEGHRDIGTSGAAAQPSREVPGGRDAAQLRSRVATVEQAGRRLSVALLADLLGLMVMTAAGVTLCARAHGVPVEVAWMADPLVGATLVICLQGDAVLAH